jgi:hypothetical protein
MTAENGMTLEEKNQELITTIESGLQVGFSSEKCIFGLQLNLNENSVDEDKTTSVINDKLYAKVYFGYRFNPPKVVQRAFKRINKAL